MLREVIYELRIGAIDFCTFQFEHTFFFFLFKTKLQSGPIQATRLL